VLGTDIAPIALASRWSKSDVYGMIPRMEGTQNSFTSRQPFCEATYDTNPSERLHHTALIEELTSLTTAEDKLSWLMERAPTQPFLTPTERSEQLRIPGCLSGLWLSATCTDGRLSFRAASESDLVQGVVGYVCDLYSDRTPGEILNVQSTLIDQLRLDGLLSVTRKRALSSTLSFILSAARKEQHPTTPLAA
jgi:cysteine desulfuration protein SufE